MTQSFDKPRAVLLAIAELSGDTYRDVDGQELIAELERQGVDIPRIGLYNLMHRLKSTGYISWAGGAGMQVERMALIRLDALGRREAESWPRDEQGNFIGDDNTVIGTPPPRMGSGNTIINFADDRGNTILNRGGTAIGSGAVADDTSIAIGAKAVAGVPALVPLLRELAAMMEAVGQTAGVDMADDLIAHAESPNPNPRAIERLWHGLKALATGEELIALAARIEPLLHSLIR
jgi:hypothetical protein